MKTFDSNRRRFLRNAATNASGIVFLSVLSKEAQAAAKHFYSGRQTEEPVYYAEDPKIKFSVIGINHNHIYGMVEAVTRGGGQLISFYAKEPDLAADFSK